MLLLATFTCKQMQRNVYSDASYISCNSTQRKIIGKHLKSINNNWQLFEWTRAYISFSTIWTWKNVFKCYQCKQILAMLNKYINQ